MGYSRAAGEGGATWTHIVVEKVAPEVATRRRVEGNKVSTEKAERGVRRWSAVKVEVGYRGRRNKVTGSVEVARPLKTKREAEAATTRMSSLVSAITGIDFDPSSSQRSRRGKGRGTGDEGVEIDPGWDQRNRQSN